MVHFAYVECGLTIDEFYALSFWEWSLEIDRVKEKQKHEQYQWETHAYFTGKVMSLIANVYRDKRLKPNLFEHTDFFPFTIYPKSEESTNKLLTPEEVEQKFGKYKEIDFKNRGTKIA